MKEEVWQNVDRYYEDLIVKPSPEYNKIVEASREAGFPPISVSSNLGKFLELCVRFQKAQWVLEIGTLGGYSTAWLARGLPPGGKVISLEIDPDRASLARQNLSQFEFSSMIDIQVGDALETMKVLYETGEGPFDLIFIDAEKTQYSVYLEWAIKLSRKGTMIIADNVVRRGKIIDQNSADVNVQGIRKFNLAVAADSRLNATVVQTLSSKGHDGFFMIYVDPESKES
jgi:predicted O-methyltransferase YrrM